LFLIFKPQKLEFSWNEDSSVPIGWSLRFLRELRSLRCVGWKPRFTERQTTAAWLSLMTVGNSSSSSSSQGAADQQRSV